MRRRGALLAALGLLAGGCALGNISIGDETESVGDGGGDGGNTPDDDDDDDDDDSSDDNDDDDDSSDDDDDDDDDDSSDDDDDDDDDDDSSDDDDDDDSGSSGDGGESTGTTFETCEDVLAAFELETAVIRSCSEDNECGQVLAGTSCGCTRDWVARNDADTAAWLELVDIAVAMECELPFVSVCDCPAADGFACEDQTCTWNYI